MAFIRQKARAGANPEYPARTQSGTNIREGSYPKLTVLIQENVIYSFSELFGTLKKKKEIKCIIIFLDLMILQHRIL